MKVRKFSMQSKLLVSIVFIMFCGLISLGVIVSLRVKQAFIDELRTSIMQTANIAINDINPDDVLEVQRDESKQSEELKKVLRKYSNTDWIKYAYIFSPDLKYIVDADPDDPAEYGESIDMVPDMQTALNGEVSADKEPTTDEWGTYISAYAPIKKDGKVVAIVGLDLGIDHINKGLDSITWGILLTIIIVCAISGVAAFLLCKFVRRKLNIFYNSIKDLNSGEADLTQTVNVTSGDEFECMAEEFNKFIASIHDIMVGIQNYSKAIRGGSHEINKVVKSTVDGMLYIANNVTVVNNSMSETISIGEGIGTIVGQTSAKTTEQASKGKVASKKSVKISDKLKSECANLEQVVEDTNKKSELLTEQVNSALVGANSIRKIDDIIAKIQSINSESRTLAFNASIEAARSGEVGRGFAVVATSMSNLNNSILELLTELKGTNNDIKCSVDNLIGTSKQMVDYVSNDIVSTFKELLKASKESQADANSLSSDFEEMSESMMGVASDMKQLTNSMMTISSAMESASSDVTETEEKAKEIKTEIESLRVIADNTNEDVKLLLDLINKYKL